jgi:hypothetical protein
MAIAEIEAAYDSDKLLDRADRLRTLVWEGR